MSAIIVIKLKIRKDFTIAIVATIIGIMKSIDSNSTIVIIAVVNFRRFVIIIHAGLECLTIVDLHFADLNQKFCKGFQQTS